MDLIKAMQVFVQVAENCSFVRAAEQLSISAPTVTKCIATLEEHLRIPLLHRNTRQVFLTPHGEDYYHRCQRILADIADAEAMTRFGKARPSGRLRVDLNGTLAASFIAPILPGFFSLYPAVQVELHNTSHVFDIRYENFDIMFRMGDLADSDLIARKISQFQGVCAGSPEYFEARGEPLSPGDLHEHQCIGYMDPQTGRSQNWKFIKYGSEISLDLSYILTCNDGPSRLSAALSGCGIVYASRKELEDAIKRGLLRPVLSEWATFIPQTSIVRHNRKYVTEAVQAFWDYVLDVYPPNSIV